MFYNETTARENKVGNFADLRIFHRNKMMQSAEEKMNILKVLDRVSKFCDKPDQFVFKKCEPKFGGEEFLVVLEKPDYIGAFTKPFICNESRSGITDTKTAKFRCNGLIVKIIVCFDNRELYDSVLHWTFVSEEYTLYKVGQLVRPSMFNEDPENVCAPGIHYFLNPLAAIAYEL